MQNFFNSDFQAYNVMEIDVDVAIIDELLPVLDGVYKNPEFYIEDPGWNSDIKWISPNTFEYFVLFKEKFDRLNITKYVEQYLDCDVSPRLYMGFFVTRSQCTGPNFHFDWINTNNNAFTFLSPISKEDHNIGLIYKRVDGTIGEYFYRRGKALLFGEKFSHSTRPGKSNNQASLLSFEFGSDKMDHWEQMSQTVATQGNLCRRPDGSFLFNSMNY